MSEDIPKKEIEQNFNYLDYIIILVLLVFVLLIIYWINRCCQKPKESNIKSEEKKEYELKLLSEDQDKQEKKIQSQVKQNGAQMDQNQSIILNIVKQFQELQKQVENQHKPCCIIQIKQTSSSIRNQIVNKINQIYNFSSNLRIVDENMKQYIRRFQDKSELKRNYGLTFSASAELYKYCNAFREVRGDGNCFYTAFGFQFLSILLFDYSLDQFNEFFNKMKQIELPMKIFVSNTDLKIDDKELEKQLLEEFQQRLTKLKLIEDINQRQEQFHTEFAAYEKLSDEIDGCLYGLSTLFFRNYSNYVVDLSDAKDALFDREKLLNWEEECNSNEVVIAELAKQLNIFVQLIFILNSTKIVFREYGINEHHKIILLIKPGHYNIGYFQQDTIVDQYIKSLNQLKGRSQESGENCENQQNYVQEAAQKIQQLYNQISILIKNNTLKQKDAFKLKGFQFIPLK